MRHSKQPIKIILANQYPLVRHTLKSIIEDVPEFELVAEINDRKELIKHAMRLSPDIIITDIPGHRNGTDETRKIIKELDHVNVILLDISQDEHAVVDMIKAGAKGYLSKDVLLHDVIVAVKTVNKGGTFFSGEVSSCIRNIVSNGDYKAYNNHRPEFSDKEIMIIKLMCEEHSTKQIAHELQTTKRAIDGMRDNILKKINAKNIAGVVVYAIRNNIYK